jgi:hypothetical protein
MRGQILLFVGFAVCGDSRFTSLPIRHSLIMPRLQRLRAILAGMAVLLVWDTPVPAQDAAPAKASPPAPVAPRYRKLAPGVEQVIPAEKGAGGKMIEIVSRHDLIELLASDPQFAERPGTEGKSPAKNAAMVQKVWTLKFAFKPIRFIQVDVPDADGRLQPTLVWYLLFHVENPFDEPVKFIPTFNLQNRESGRIFPDQLIPIAIPYIQRREDPHRKLLNTIEIEGEIPAGHEVWGVATWAGMDPSMDRFSVFVRGLSNSYQWVDPPGAFKPGDPPGTGRKLTLKTLQLNFWRPGDALYEHEAEIRYGIPGDVDYRWLYQ